MPRSAPEAVSARDRREREERQRRRRILDVEVPVGNEPVLHRLAVVAVEGNVADLGVQEEVVVEPPPRDEEEPGRNDGREYCGPAVSRP